MKKLTQEEILEIMCAPASIDEPEESDFEESSEMSEKLFVQSWIARERGLN
ncbi:hypothetical protein AGMMS49957_00020 [Synergistales bacterium]|nr:hypothetical protein AGMMS49957_00020 [Synergistales bacterium]